MTDIVKTPYTGPTTSLSSYSPEGAAQSRLLSQMAQAAQKAANAKVNSVSSRYEAEIASLDRKVAEWKDLGKDIGTATSDLSALVGRLKSMRSKLDGIKTAIVKAEQRDQEGAYVNPAGYAKSFDTLVKGLQKDATEGAKQPNLLGSDDVTYSYRTGIYGQTNSVSGGFVGNSYSITDTEGKKWVLDTHGELLRRYDSYPGDEAAESANIVDGIRLDSISGSDVTFTVGPNSAGPQQFTGTLEKKGLGLMNTWYYDGLATEDGRNRAQADVADAREAINLEISRYELALTSAKFYEDRARLEAGGYKDKSNSLRLESAQEIAKAQEDLTRQYSAAQGAVAQALAQKVNYAKIFQSVGGTAFGNKLVNILT